MSYACSDYGLAANVLTTMNATPTWNCKERSCQTKDIFSIKKLVSRASCKTVEDVEIFQIRKKSKPILGLVDLPEIDYYFQGDFCVCPVVRKAMTLND
jgi:hypothetical protein